MTWEVAHHASLLDNIRLPAGTAAGVRRSLGRTGPGRPTSKDPAAGFAPRRPPTRRRVERWRLGGDEAHPLPSAARGGGLRGPVLVLPQAGDRIGQRGPLGQLGEQLLVLRRGRDAAPQLPGGPLRCRQQGLQVAPVGAVYRGAMISPRPGTRCRIADRALVRQLAGGSVVDAVGVGVEEVLAASRLGLRRLTPEQTVAAASRGALIIDTRTEAHRREQGELPSALVIDRTVLEWRLDPVSPSRIPEATKYDIEVVVVCRQGYSSSLAAASLRAIGLHRTTDLAGGVDAWLAAGLPVDTGPADIRP